MLAIVYTFFFLNLFWYVTIVRVAYHRDPHDPHVNSNPGDALTMSDRDHDLAMQLKTAFLRLRCDVLSAECFERLQVFPPQHAKYLLHLLHAGPLPYLSTHPYHRLYNTVV